MKKIDVTLPLNHASKKVAWSFEKAVIGQALTIKSRGTLKTIPACIHWHIINHGHKGTLEATFDKNKLRLWLCYHDNRYADWIDEAIDRIKNSFEAR
jgi:hypothetical protein